MHMSGWEFLAAGEPRMIYACLPALGDVSNSCVGSPSMAGGL